MTWPAQTYRTPTRRDHEARARYEAGATVAEVAQFLCLSKAQARVRLHRVGTAMRPRGHRLGTPRGGRG